MKREKEKRFLARSDNETRDANRSLARSTADLPRVRVDPPLVVAHKSDLLAGRVARSRNCQSDYCSSDTSRASIVCSLGLVLSFAETLLFHRARALARRQLGNPIWGGGSHLSGSIQPEPGGV